MNQPFGDSLSKIPPEPFERDWSGFDRHNQRGATLQRRPRL